MRRDRIWPSLLVLALCAPFTAVAALAASADARDAPAVSVAAVARVAVRPGDLDRGPGPRVPQVVGTTIVDGDRTVAVDARELQLLGVSGDDYVVRAWNDAGGSTVERVSPEGDRRAVLEGGPEDVVLSADGEQLFRMRLSGRRSVVTAHDAETGEAQARRTFRGYASVLDADAGAAVVSLSGPDRTLTWSTGTGATTPLAERPSYFADLRADRLATVTGQPPEGMCSTLRTLATRRVLWRSCEQAVLALSPDGRRVAGWLLAMDGPPTELSVHTAGGRLLAEYRTSGWIGGFAWETDRTVLLLVHGTKRSVLVRCRGEACERASARQPVPWRGSQPAGGAVSSVRTSR